MVPGGYRYYLDGMFYDFGTSSSLLTSTDFGGGTIIYRLLSASQTTVFRSNISKAAGKYVRCVKD